MAVEQLSMIGGIFSSLADGSLASWSDSQREKMLSSGFAWLTESRFRISQHSSSVFES